MALNDNVVGGFLSSLTLKKVLVNGVFSRKDAKMLYACILFTNYQLFDYKMYKTY